MDAATIALAVTSILFSIVAIAVAWYIAVTRPRRVPKPRIDVNLIIRPATKEKSPLVKGYEGWVIPQNTGTYAAHDVRVVLRVPSGEKIIDIEPGYFTIKMQNDECVEMTTGRFEPNFGVPPIYFFATEKPVVEYWPHEDKGTVSVTRD